MRWHSTNCRIFRTKYEKNFDIHSWLFLCLPNRHPNIEDTLSFSKHYKGSFTKFHFVFCIRFLIYQTFFSQQCYILDPSLLFIFIKKLMRFLYAYFERVFYYHVTVLFQRKVTLEYKCSSEKYSWIKLKKKTRKKSFRNFGKTKSRLIQIFQGLLILYSFHDLFIYWDL